MNLSIPSCSQGNDDGFLMLQTSLGQCGRQTVFLSDSCGAPVRMFALSTIRRHAAKTSTHARRWRTPRTPGSMRSTNSGARLALLFLTEKSNTFDVLQALSVHPRCKAGPDTFRRMALTCSPRVMGLGAEGPQDEIRREPNVSDSGHGGLASKMRYRTRPIET